jgi:branched-chain amino acid transport system permease protein
LPLAGVASATAALVFGYFCVRLTKIYFAMLTLAFAQIVWAICFKWNAVTGGEQGFSNVPYPELGWMEVLPGLGRMRPGELYFYLTLVIVGLCLYLLRRITNSPFGRILTTIRENPERAEFVGIDVRRFELAAFVIAGTFAGLAGALFGIFNRGVFPDFGYWAKSAEVLIMVILGGMGQFFGPLVGAFALIALNQQITSYTEYWPLVLGLLLIVLLYAFPAGLMGTAADLVKALRRRRDA